MPSRALPAAFLLLLAASCGDDLGDAPDAGEDGGRSDAGPGYDAGPGDAAVPDAAPDAAADAGVPGSRVTLVLASGPMTFEARDATGAPLRLTAGFAADLAATGREAVYAADGATLRRLDADSLRFVEPLALTDPDGAPMRPPSFVAGVLGTATVVAGLFGSSVRILDATTGAFSGPAPLLEVIDMMGTTAPLAPRALAIVRLRPDSVVPVALGADGELLLGDGALQFLEAIQSPATCHEGTAIEAETLVAGTMPDIGGPLADSVLLIDGSSAYPIAASFCFDDPIPLLAEDGSPVAPDLAFAGDLDGDGEDELVLVEDP